MLPAAWWEIRPPRTAQWPPAAALRARRVPRRPHCPRSAGTRPDSAPSGPPEASCDGPLGLDPVVALLFQLQGQALATGPRDAAVHQHVDEIRHHALSQAL